MREEAKQQAFARNSQEDQVIFEFIRAMNIARRNLVAYPRAHVLVVQSFQKVLSILQNYFQYSNHLTLGWHKMSFCGEQKLWIRKILSFRVSPESCSAMALSV